MFFNDLLHHRTRHSRRSPLRPPRRRLLLELLESRTVPSTIPPVNVNTDTEGVLHNETTIAVNPTNPLNMIGSANDLQASVSSGGQVFLTGFHHAHVTFDGGQTWTEYAVPFRGYNSTSDPAVSFDADGTAYLSNLAYVQSQNLTFNGNNADVVVSHSTDGGQTWSTPVRVAAGTGSGADQSAGTFNDKPYLAAWGQGNAIVTWTQFHFGPTGAYVDAPIYASVTHDGGNTWTDPAPITPSDVGNPQVFDEPSVPTVAADGRVYVAFEKHNVSPGFPTAVQIFASRGHYMVVNVDPTTSQPLGGSVEVGLVYDGPNDYPINVEGRQTYQDSQFRYGAPGNITADPTKAQHLAVIWSDMRNNPYPDGMVPSTDPYAVQTNSDIIVSQSSDGGQTWSAPTAIKVAGDQFQPWGTYNSSGLLQVGYYDRSYDPANHEYGYTLASEKRAGSLRFTFQQVTTALSDPTKNDAYGLAVTVNPSFPNATTFMGDYSGVAAVSPTLVAAMWTDMRLQRPNGLSAEDAFFALVDPPAALNATAMVPRKPSKQSLSQAAVTPMLTEALARWSKAGVDTSSLHGIDVRIADLGGTTLGLASGRTIWLDDNAADWGWFVDLTPWDDSEFTTPGNQGEKHRMDLLAVLEHEVGHLLSYEHAADGVMAETLAAGTRLTPGSKVAAPSWATDAYFALFTADEKPAWVGGNFVGRGRHRK